jgi:hypothetical protein
LLDLPDQVIDVVHAGRIGISLVGEAVQRS